MAHAVNIAEFFVRTKQEKTIFLHPLELLPAFQTEEFVPFVKGEPHWTLAGAEAPDWPEEAEPEA